MRYKFTFVFKSLIILRNTESVKVSSWVPLVRIAGLSYAGNLLS